MIYQIFGGYLQSQVKCLECKYNSNTFDPCLDLSLDIKGCDSVKRALELFIKPELLSKGNKYKCERFVKKKKKKKKKNKSKKKKKKKKKNFIIKNTINS